MVQKIADISSENTEIVEEVSIEIGHHVAKRSTPTNEGCTHDWVVYVKLDKKELVEKVQFNLHPTFKNPKRVVKTAPFQVVESGYGGFALPIDIYFKMNNQKTKTRIDYFLFLGVAPTVSHSVIVKVLLKSCPDKNKHCAVTKKAGRPRKNKNDAKSNYSSTKTNSHLLISELSSSNSNFGTSMTSSSTSSSSSTSLTSSPSSFSSPQLNLTQNKKHTLSTVPSDELHKFMEWNERHYPELNNLKNHQHQTTNDNFNNASTCEAKINGCNVCNSDRINELVNLQSTLMNLKNRKAMKKVIGIIKRKGYLKINQSTFDFDLNEMDDETIKNIIRCL